MPIPNWLAVAGLLLWVGYEIVLRRRTDRAAASLHGGDSDRGSTRLLVVAYGLAIVLIVGLGVFDVHGGHGTRALVRPDPDAAPSSLGIREEVECRSRALRYVSFMLRTAGSEFEFVGRSNMCMFRTKAAGRLWTVGQWWRPG